MPALINYKRAIEDLGWRAALVERWIPQARKSIDVFGFADYVVIDPEDSGTLYLQVTSGGNGSTRVTKILELGAVVKDVLKSGNRIEVWDWRKYKIKPAERLVSGSRKTIRVDAARWGIVLVRNKLQSVVLPTYRQLLGSSLGMV